MKNEYEVRGDVTLVELIRRRDNVTLECLVDTEDLTRLDFFTKLYACKNNRGQCYVRGSYKDDNGKWKFIELHRFLMDTPKGLYTDHINHNTLDNRKSNLRNCTNAENAHNREVVNVYWAEDRKKWRVFFSKNYKKHHFGQFDSYDEAYKCAVEARSKLMPYSQDALRRSHG